MPKYSYLFKDASSSKQYLFVSNLASGRYNQAQLVKDTSTGHLLVRKVSKSQSTGPFPPSTPPNEIEIIRRLQSFPPPSSSTTPNLANLIKSHDLPIPIPTTTSSDNPTSTQPKPQPPQKSYARISYWTLYNGGTTTQLIKPHIKRAHDAPAVYPIPYAVIARFIWQTCEALQYMYRGSPDEVIFHCDLHGGNIFVHWEDLEGDDNLGLPDFYIGDFGNSRSVSTSSTSDVGRIIPWPWDVSCSGLLRCIIGLVKAGRSGLKEGGVDPRGVEIGKLQNMMCRLNLEDRKRDPSLAPPVLRRWASPVDMGLLSLTDSVAGVVGGVSSSVMGPGVSRSNGAGDVSRPPDLGEVICRAKELERLFTSPGELDERGMEVYRGFCRRGREAARELVGREPFVFELKTDGGELGSWWVGGSGAFVLEDIPSPWYVARLLENEDGVDVEGSGGGSGMYRCVIVGDEMGHIGKDGKDK